MSKLNINNKSVYKLRKALVFVLVIIFFVITVLQTLGVILVLESDTSSLMEKNYTNSRRFYEKILGTSYNNDGVYSQLYSLLVDYKSEKYILEDKEFSKEDKMEVVQRLYHKYIDSYGFDEEDSQEKFIKDHTEDIERALRYKREAELVDMNNILKALKENDKNIKYYASNGSEVFTNVGPGEATKENFKKYKLNIIKDKADIEITNKLEENNLNNENNINYTDFSYSYRDDYNDYIDLEEFKIYIGFTDEFLMEEMDRWDTSKINASSFFKRLSLSIILLFIFFIRLIFMTGRKSDGDNTKVEMAWIDKLYTDINFSLCLVIIFSWFGFLSLTYNDYLIGSDMIIKNEYLILITGVLGSLGLILVLSLIRHIKNKTLIKHSLIGSIFIKIYRSIESLYNSGSRTKKIVAILILYPVVVVFSTFLFPLVMWFVIWKALEKNKEFEEIKKGVEEIKSGNLDYRIDIKEKGEFKDLADSINEIGDGLKNSVDNELRSERYKTELITNVSHDIRTPLTSIITYIDLLKIEKNQEKRLEYMEVLDNKSKRLKKLIDDLFEASKITSGNIPLNLGKINLVSIINQSLGELNEKIEENSLDFILNFADEEVFVLADGDLLWRAIENLLSNIFKYGLKGSRVYVDIGKEAGKINLTIKNISAYELNISEEELMERFKRGEESRTSEGSGLGLSITKSLIEAQGGSFHISIDGDLFKTIIFLGEYSD